MEASVVSVSSTQADYTNIPPPPGPIQKLKKSFDPGFSIGKSLAGRVSLPNQGGEKASPAFHTVRLEAWK